MAEKEQETNNMQKGFFYLRNNVYYGEYPADQTSGIVRISRIKPENIKTDMPFSEDDLAVKPVNNHAFTEPEFTYFEQGLERVFKCLGITRQENIDFSKTEEKLGITLPKEVKILYSFICSSKELTEGTERFLPLEGLEIDGENLVFYKIRRTPVGLSLKNGTLMNYHKGMWEYHAGGENFFYALNRVVVKAICSMPFNKVGKVFGAIRVAVSPEGELSSAFEGCMKILDEYWEYGNILLYNEKGALGLYRHNGFSSDLLVGCKDRELLDNITDVKLEVKWSDKPVNKI